MLGIEPPISALFATVLPSALLRRLPYHQHRWYEIFGSAWVSDVMGLTVSCVGVTGTGALRRCDKVESKSVLYVSSMSFFNFSIQTAATSHN